MFGRLAGTVTLFIWMRKKHALKAAHGYWRKKQQCKIISRHSHRKEGVHNTIGKVRVQNTIAIINISFGWSAIFIQINK